MHINKELKQRLLKFIEAQIGPGLLDQEARELYAVLGRKPGRPVGWRKKVVDNVS